MAADDPLRELGRAVAQVHLKLARIEEKLDAAPSPARSATHDADLDTLLDLVDAVESALERRPARQGARRGSRGWFRRAGSAEGDDLWRGLAVAVSEVRERLQRAGIEPAPLEGAFDPRLHRAIEIVPVRAGGIAGTLAATHRRGWLRRRGAEREVLRTAQVSVHGEEP